MLWPVINVIAGAICTAIIIYKLSVKLDRFTRMEQVGMGMTAAGMVLTVGPLIAHDPTPYDDWSGTLLRVGIAVYFIGRQLRHRHNNASARRAARRHLEQVRAK